MQIVYRQHQQMSVMIACGKHSLSIYFIIFLYNYIQLKND